MSVGVCSLLDGAFYMAGSLTLFTLGIKKRPGPPDHKWDIWAEADSAKYKCKEKESMRHLLSHKMFCSVNV